MAFNYNTYTGRVQIDDSLNVPSNVTPSLNNNTINYGNRRPLLNLSFSGTTTTSSQIITGISSLIIPQLYVGLAISGTGIPTGSIISSIYSTTITISIAATASATVTVTASEVSLPVPTPLAGFPSYDYYQIYALNTNLITAPGDLLTWFKSSGYQVNLGLSGTDILSNIGAFSPNPASSGNCTLYFSGQSLNVAAFANQTVSGTFSVSGTSITGSIVSITTGVFNQTVTSNFTGTTTSGSAIITALNINADLLMVGSLISGTGIPTGSSIISINSSSSITISASATASASGVALSYQSVTTLQADTAIVVNSTSYSGLQIGDNLTINYVVQSANPDINRTEPFIMNLWQAATAMNGLNGLNQNATVGAPAVYFMILPDAASTNYYGPTGNAMAMGVAPTAATVSGGLTTLVIPLTANYASFVPNIQLGATSIVQATSSATGTVFQSVINGNNLNIQLSNVTGVFDTSHNITLTLDNTITVMSQQGTYFANNKLSLRTFPCIYEIFTTTDVNNILLPLANYVVGLNAAVTANSGQGNCSVVFGNQSYTPIQAISSLPTSFNNPYYDEVYIDFVQRPGVTPRSFAQSITTMATIFASNDYPFNPLNDILISGFDNSPFPQDWIDMTVGGSADQLIALGVNVIATNSSGQQYLYIGRSNQTNFNGNIDSEFYPTYVLDTKDYIRRSLITICNNNGVGQVRQNDITLKGIATDCVNLQNQMGINGDQILANTNVTTNLISVTRSPNNTLGVVIVFPIQQNPGLLFAYGNVINYSVNITLG